MCLILILHYLMLLTLYYRKFLLLIVYIHFIMSIVRKTSFASPPASTIPSI